MAESTRIESVDNPKVKDAVRLRDRRSRRKTGRFLVEGAREISRALEAGHRPITVFVEPRLVSASDDGARALDLCRPTDARVFELSPRAWAKVALREDRDGLVAVFPIPKAALDDLALGSAPLVLAVIDVEKPGNLGGVLRSADAFGVSALVAEGGTDIWNPNVVRASLGSLFTVPLATAPAGELLPWMRSAGLRLVAASPDGETRPEDVPLDGPVAIVVGSEERGLDASVLDAADVRVRIPMRGSVDSLNVSVSAGVLLYEAVRQRSSR
jgi:TrmH family RNA methyltransferase